MLSRGLFEIMKLTPAKNSEVKTLFSHVFTRFSGSFVKLLYLPTDLNIPGQMGDGRPRAVTSQSGPAGNMAGGNTTHRHLCIMAESPHGNDPSEASGHPMRPSTSNPKSSWVSGGLEPSHHLTGPQVIWAGELDTNKNMTTFCSFFFRNLREISGKTA